MKAVWYERTGAAPDVLAFGDMPTPVAGPGEVRVRLEASGVNPADAGRRAGSYRPMEFPRVIPNSDGAGIVDQVGDGVTRLQIGQRVWLYNGQRNGRAFGTAAEYIAFTEQRGVNRVVDVDFGGNIATTSRLMAMNSAIAVYATNGNRNPVIAMRELMEKCIALRPLVLFALPPPLLVAAQVDISKWLAA